MAVNGHVYNERKGEGGKMTYHMQRKTLGSKDYQTVASFADSVEAAECYLHVYRDTATDVRLIVESRDGRGVETVVLGTGAKRDGNKTGA